MTANKELILQIYDTIADPTLWPNVLSQVADQANAFGCIIFEWQNFSTNRQLLVTTASNNYDPLQLERYLQKFSNEEARDQDLFEAHSLRSDGIDLISDTVLAPSSGALKKLKNVETLQKLGILHRAAGLLNKDNTAEARFSIQLGADRSQLEVSEAGFMRSILPHIAKAFDLGRPAKQLSLENSGLLEAMNGLNVGVCLLDPFGRQIVENDEFRRQREEFCVFRVAPNGALYLSRASDEVLFRKLKADAFNHGKFGARPRKEAIATNNESFLCIEVAPLTRSKEIGSQSLGGWIIHSSDTSLPFTCQTQPLKMAYKLTNAEHALINLIAQGLTNSVIAERRGRSISTINAQVKSILSKTHCATRTQLVRLMMSFGADYTAPHTNPKN